MFNKGSGRRFQPFCMATAVAAPLVLVFLNDSSPEQACDLPLLASAISGVALQEVLQLAIS